MIANLIKLQEWRYYSEDIRYIPERLQQRVFVVLDDGTSGYLWYNF